MAEPDQHRDRVDDLRQQLRALGYLDAGVDRFLLAPAAVTRGPIALAARSSIRVGLLGGLLLGPSAAIGVGARLPGLVNGLRDAGVIALYLAVFFFLAITVTSFAVTVAAAILARGRDEGFQSRAARVSRAAGWITTLACLLYLTLWWRNANAGFGWSAPAWTAFALLVAVAISLLLGHAQRITTIAALAAAAGPAALLPSVGGRSWRMVLAGGALAFAGAAALLVTTASVEGGRGPQRLPLTVVSSGISLRVVAIDGFDPALSDELSGGGGGDVTRVRAALQPQDTSDPARAWTTIATGVGADRHGVHGIETRRVAGVQGSVAASDDPLARTLRAATDLVRLTRPSVASRDERRAKTIWEVAEDAGLRTAVVNWWATWPASAGGGVVVTDRAVLRLEQGGALDAEIAPASLYEPLRAAWPSIRARARAAATALTAADEATAGVIRRSAELDATIVGIFDAIPPPARDLDVIYLPGLDIAQHALMASDRAATPSTVAARIDALRGYYRFLRVLTAPLLVPNPRMHVVLITQPGRVEAPTPGAIDILQPRTVNAPQQVDGAPAARVEDIAPTLLQALGIPLSRELAGGPIPGLSTVSTPRYVDSYGRPGAPMVSRTGKPLDQEMIDRLRSLGYVK